MKLSVRVRGEWFVLPCKGTESVHWLGEEAIRRYERTRAGLGSGKPQVDACSNGSVVAMEPPQDRGGVIHCIRKAKGGALLHDDDEIAAVLDENDFVLITLESDNSIGVPSSYLGPADNMSSTTEDQSDLLPFQPPAEFITLDGNSLTTDDLMRLARGEVKIKLSKAATFKVEKSRRMLQDIIDDNKVVYGITTGFGKFAQVVVPKDDLAKLQENLIRSHSAGLGHPLLPERTRAILALRINVLAKGYSGISLKVLQQYIDAFNASCLSWVPEKGTVGASGDLAPLAHLALGLMGEGKMWCPETGWGDASQILKAHGLQAIKLGPKEGLALINGTQFITALGVEAVERSYAIARQADIVAALTLEVLKGTSKAFCEEVQNVRPHKGQKEVARRIRSVLHSDTYPSQISESHRFCNRVQDAYTIRCVPQVHGIVNDTIEFVRGILTVEMNSATDNPLVFVDKGQIISAGNFHGEYPAKALDYLAIGVHELSSMSERRVERLVNPAYSELPAFLVANGGLNSGFMMAQCTAAALVSENKVLCHPSSVDSLTTSAGTEDHVSMGGFAARKALRVVEHVEQVIAIELLAACQAIEFLRPLLTTAPLEAVYKLVRTVVGPWDEDRQMSPDIEAATKLLREEKVWSRVKPFMDSYFDDQNMDTEVMSPTSSYHSSSFLSKRHKREREPSVDGHLHSRDDHHHHQHGHDSH